MSGREETLLRVAGDIAARLPPPYDLEAAEFKYPMDHAESLNTVFCQEVVRYNRCGFLMACPACGLHCPFAFYFCLNDSMS